MALVPSGGVTETTKPGPLKTQRVLLSKVPAVTVWFWIIKILCTTVGESFADWINVRLGLGLHTTALIFTVVLAAVLAWQLRLSRYVPYVYWLTVVIVSVTGTLYTDILTDKVWCSARVEHQRIRRRVGRASSECGSPGSAPCRSTAS